MAYTSFIECDSESCNSRVQVPRSDAVPVSWVAVRYMKPKVSKDGKPIEPEAIVKFFCSWKCSMHFVQEMVKATAIAKESQNVVG